MKRNLLILLVLIVSHYSSAQVGTGKLFVGGGLGFNSGENNVGFSISPAAHYFISDQISLGGFLNFATSRDNRGEDIYQRTSTFSISPAFRYWKELGEKVHLYGQASIGFAGSDINLFNGNEKADQRRSNTFNSAVGIGVVYAPLEKLGFDLNVNIISFDRTATTNEIFEPTTTQVNNTFSFGFDSFAPAFGIYYILGN